jgi:hypothetical protein
MMKYPVLDMLRKFLCNEIAVEEFRTVFGEWNRTGLWEGLTKAERKLLDSYFWNYFDMYGGESLPKFGWWERFKRNMRGEANVDLPLLKQGTAELLTALERQSAKHGPSAHT